MILSDLLQPQFKQWELDLYDKDGEFLLGSYEKDRDTDKEWKAFIELYKDTKVLEVVPAATLPFLGVELDLKL